MRTPTGYRSCLIASVLALALTLPAGVAAQSTCTASQYKAAGAAALRKAKCKSVAARKGIAVDPQCLAKAETKLAKAWTKAEAKGDCVASVDQASSLAIVDSFVDEVMDLLEPPLLTYVCCELGGGTCGWSDTAAFCTEQGWTPGAPGDVCNAQTGTCTPPPGALGNCCNLGMSTCVAGPTAGPGPCSTFPEWTFFPNSTCTPGVGCSP